MKKNIDKKLIEIKKKVKNKENVKILKNMFFL